MERTADDPATPVFLGVDTHSDAHVAVALDGAGRRLGVLAVPNSAAGYTELLNWALGFGALAAAARARAATGPGSRASSGREERACWR